MSHLQAAQLAMSRGFFIFPINEAGSLNSDNGRYIDKEPHLTNPPYRLKWSDVATRDIRLIQKWWHHWPLANIGVACKPSGILVVDCDQPKEPNLLAGTRWEYLHDLCGPLVDGEILFDQVCHRYGGNWQEIQGTYRVATGSGGVHYYFRWPLGVQASQSSIVKGVLDVRCNGGTDGGYVLGAGSQTHSGPYELVIPGPVLPAQQWLVDLCREAPVPPRPLRGPYDRPSVIYSGLQDTVRLALEGNRNDTLNWASWKMGRDGSTEDEALETLTSPALDAGMDSSEIEDTIKSGWRKGSR